MRKLVIAIDFDDVLVDSTRALLAPYNQKYGTELSLEHMYQSNYEPFGVSSQQAAIKQLNSIMQDPAYTTLKPTADTIEVITRLAGQHELHVITGRAAFLEPYTREVLDLYFKGCFMSLEHTGHFDDGDKNAIRRTKGEVCQQISADVMIDDLPLHLHDVIAAGVQEVIIFGDYPWNRSQSLPDKAIRCLDWLSVEKEIEKIANQ